MIRLVPAQSVSCIRKGLKERKVCPFLKTSFIICLHRELEMCALSMAAGSCNPVKQWRGRSIANESVRWWRAVRITFLNTLKYFPEVHAKQPSWIVWLFLCNREHIKWYQLELPTKNWKMLQKLHRYFLRLSWNVDREKIFLWFNLEMNYSYSKFHVFR